MSAWSWNLLGTVHCLSHRGAICQSYPHVLPFGVWTARVHIMADITSRGLTGRRVMSFSHCHAPREAPSIRWPVPAAGSGAARVGHASVTGGRHTAVTSPGYSRRGDPEDGLWACRRWSLLHMFARAESLRRCFPRSLAMWRTRRVCLSLALSR